MRGMLLAMSVLLRSGSPRRLAVLLGLAVMGLVFAPSASGAAPLDTVTATGSGTLTSNININAQSGTSGQNPTGAVSFTYVNVIPLSGSVTCLSVTGPDQGGGTPTAPTTAVLNFQDTSSNFGVVTVMLVDNGGGGADTFTSVLGRAPTDCSPVTPIVTDTLSNGRAAVFDAPPPLPTSKDQCKHGGWQQFGFKNQGQCVAFVNHEPKP